MHSVLATLAVNIVLYIFFFLLAAFFAARNYCRHHDPEQQPFADSQDKTVQPMEEVEDGWLHVGTFSWSDLGKEVMNFAKQPVPFLIETANITDNEVHHIAGLDARIFLHFTNLMLKLFSVVAVIAVLIILLVNLLSQKAAWMPQGDFDKSTANGLYNPAQSLLIHSMCALFISVVVVLVVYFLRENLAKYTRGEPSKDAVFPVQAYTVEIQGMRVEPIMTKEELRGLLDLRLQGKYFEVVVVEDVTDLVDISEQKQEMEKQLDSSEQQGAAVTSLRYRYPLRKR